MHAWRCLASCSKKSILCVIRLAERKKLLDNFVWIWQMIVPMFFYYDYPLVLHSCLSSHRCLHRCLVTKGEKWRISYLGCDMRKHTYTCLGHLAAWMWCSPSIRSISFPLWYVNIALVGNSMMNMKYSYKFVPLFVGVFTFCQFNASFS